MQQNQTLISRLTQNAIQKKTPNENQSLNLPELTGICSLQTQQTQKIISHTGTLLLKRITTS